MIAGQRQLDKNLWADFEPFVVSMPIDPFSDAEAREYLARRSITDETMVETILDLSRRLPLLLAMLAAGEPRSAAALGDPCSSAVERFLKGIADPKLCEVALDAALLRVLDRDVLVAVACDGDTDRLFTWLSRMPFVQDRGSHWCYHEVVRQLMLRNIRRESPQRWKEIHERLVEYYGRLRTVFSSPGKAALRDETWQRLSLEYVYHQLCAAPQAALESAIDGFVSALNTKGACAQSWADTILQAGSDTDAEVVKQWGQVLTLGTRNLLDHANTSSIKMFSDLAKYQSLNKRWLPRILAWRGQQYQIGGEYSPALNDLSEALRLAPDNPSYLSERGDIHRNLNLYVEALADYARALQIKADYYPAIVGRAHTYLKMHDASDCIADCNRALEMGRRGEALTIRGFAYIDSHQYALALDDFESAIADQPDYHTTYEGKALALYNLRRQADAVAVLSEAEGLDLCSANCIARVGMTYLRIKEPNKAIILFDRALKQAPEDPRLLTDRGRVHIRLEDYAHAIADFDQAISVQPSYHRAYEEKAYALLCSGDSSAALQVLEEAGAPREACAQCMFIRGQIFLELGKCTEALQEVDSCITIRPCDATAVACRGEILAALGENEKALAAFDHAITLDPDCHRAYAKKGRLLGTLKRCEEAVACLSQGVRTEPCCTDCLALRGREYSGMGELRKALEDWNRVIVLMPDNAFAYDNRGMLLLEMRRYDEALSDLSRVGQLRPEARILAACGDACCGLHRYQDAVAYYEQAAGLDPKGVDYFDLIGNAHLASGSLSAARDAFEASLLVYKPAGVNALICLGLIAYHLGDTQKASSFFDRVLEESDLARRRGDSDIGIMWMMRSVASLVIEGVDAAVRGLDEAVQMMPPPYGITFKPVEMLAMTENSPEGLSEYFEALDRLGLRSGE